MCGALRRQTDPARRPIVEYRSALRPLDHRDRIRRWLIQTRVDPGHTFETIEVVVLDGQPAPIAVVQDKRRAVHTGGHAECLGDPFYQLGLSSSELTLERDDVP